eukprot:1136861-Pelagomonas_calceolata.AAC.4
MPHGVHQVRCIQQPYMPQGVPQGCAPRSAARCMPQDVPQDQPQGMHLGLQQGMPQDLHQRQCTHESYMPASTCVPGPSMLALKLWGFSRRCTPCKQSVLQPKLLPTRCVHGLWHECARGSAQT